MLVASMWLLILQCCCDFKTDLFFNRQKQVAMKGLLHLFVATTFDPLKILDRWNVVYLGTDVWI